MTSRHYWQTLHRSTLVVAAAVAAFSLGACNRADEGAAAGRADSVPAKTERAGAEAKQEASQATSSVKAAVSDASITASVNAQLAGDSELSALRIDVDTNAGKVALKGTAPSAEARERAAKLAREVTGVTDVDNQLAIKG
ncbi:MAG TPA: BON domain-containing protein [Rubrivivax sp.]|nr:BON domain-containing protein [Rubrivivax sp.]